jgi:hypothetical protein
VSRSYQGEKVKSTFTLFVFCFLAGVGHAQTHVNSSAKLGIYIEEHLGDSDFTAAIVTGELKNALAESSQFQLIDNEDAARLVVVVSSKPLAILPGATDIQATLYDTQGKGVIRGTLRNFTSAQKLWSHSLEVADIVELSSKEREPQELLWFVRYEVERAGIIASSTCK